jgi:DhnA family fructose-bisphosphate aldolase class Ia
MNGLRRGVARLFGERDRLFVLAMDHAQGGLVEGLEKPLALMAELAASPIDGYILNVGLAGCMADRPFLSKKLILRTSFGGTMLSDGSCAVHANHVSPSTARRLGADAVLMMFPVGGPDHLALQAAAADIDAFHAEEIPVIAEIISCDFKKWASPEVQQNGARIAAELGADVVKAFWVEGFDRVVASCPAPVILAGGPKDLDIMEVARSALAAGAKGFAFGRNLFLHPRPAEMAAELDALLAGA